MYYRKNTAKVTDSDLRNLMAKVSTNAVAYSGGNYIMTDDKAPVELLGMRVIDQLIQDEVAYYKKIYEKDGLQGLLEQL